MEDDRVRQHLEGAGVLSRSMMKAVTGQRSNQLNYVPSLFSSG
jgi:hypothetical protein